MLALVSCSKDSITGCKPLHTERTKTAEVHELVIAVFKAVYVVLQMNCTTHIPQLNTRSNLITRVNKIRYCYTGTGPGVRGSMDAAIRAQTLVQTSIYVESMVTLVEIGLSQ